LSPAGRGRETAATETATEPEEQQKYQGTGANKSGEWQQ